MEIKNLFAFDFDDTLAVTPSLIGVRRYKDGNFDKDFKDWIHYHNLDISEIKFEGSEKEIVYFSSDQFAEYEKAEKSIEEVLRISPRNFPASIVKAQILSAQNESIEAEEILRDLLIKKNKDPSIWMQLSEIQRAGKNIVGYHLSKGEYYLLIGDFQNALNQFQFAFGLSGHSFQTSETILTKIKYARERIASKKGL